jgi:AcrR family transcriptional regulator
MNTSLRNPSVESSKRRGNRTTRIPEIVDCAIRVFALHGDSGFTQRRIASEVGIQLSTLQHYFDTRDALLRAAIEESSRRYLHHSQTLIRDPHKSAEERLAAFVDDSFETFSDASTLVTPFALEYWSLSERNEWVRELTERNSERYHALFCELVGCLNPALSLEEIRLRGAFLYSHWEGLLVFLRRTTFGQTEPLSLKEPVKARWLATARDGL